MRFYETFDEALNECRRDVAELGTNVHPQTMQDKDIADDPEYETKEYRNLIYTVTRPKLEDLNPTQPWADAEFEERLTGTEPGQGEAWKLRPEVWQEFADRGFGYTYGERFALSLGPILTELRGHPDSRQLFLSIWCPSRDAGVMGKERVPCSLGYWLALRQGLLSLTYLQRSADIVTHFENDVYLAHKLQRWIADEVGAGIGQYIHWIGSLHAYKKDVAGIF